MSRPVRFAALAFSVIAFALAIAPSFLGETRYDASLAVLTATLIALVWYSAFTYRLAQTALAQLRVSERALRLTEEQLRVAGESLKLSLELTTGRNRELRRDFSPHVKRLWKYVESLPEYEPPGGGQIIRRLKERHPPPEDSDLQAFSGAAAKIDALQGNIAIEAETKMRTIGRIVRAASDGTYDSGKFPKDEWIDAVKEARRHLGVLKLFNDEQEK